MPFQKVILQVVTTTLYMQANEYFVTHQQKTSIQVTIIDMFGCNLLHIGISFHNIACAFIYNLFMCTKYTIQTTLHVQSVTQSKLALCHYIRRIVLLHL